MSPATEAMLTIRPAGFQHMGNHGPGHADGSQIIGLHHAFIFTHRDLEKPSEGAVAGVVDQDIDAPPGTFHLIHQRLNGIFVGHIAGEGGAGAQLFRQLPEGFARRAARTGKSPRRASSRAISRPIPLEAPVTRTIRFRMLSLLRTWGLGE